MINTIILRTDVGPHGWSHIQVLFSCEGLLSKQQLIFLIVAGDWAKSNSTDSVKCKLLAIIITVTLQAKLLISVFYLYKLWSSFTEQRKHDSVKNWLTLLFCVTNSKAWIISCWKQNKNHVYFNTKTTNNCTFRYVKIIAGFSGKLVKMVISGMIDSMAFQCKQK